MVNAKNLCELVRHDRELAGLTQEQLATKLNETECRPMDTHTKKPKIASRTWLAKLEAGLLKRELSLNVRKWLAEKLNGNVSLYQTLPSNLNPGLSKKEAFIFGNLDVLPLVKFLAKSDLDKITFDVLLDFLEAYRRCSEIGISLIDPLKINENKKGVN